MNYLKPLAVLALGLTTTGPLLAQTSDTAETPPADAAATDTAEAAATETTEAAATEGAAAEAGGEAKTLPNGQDITPDYEESGRWYTVDGIPTYKIEADGTVDFATFNGYRRYSAECHVCHGPDGEGSTYAPALKDSVLKLDYYQFQEVVASGKKDVNASQNQVMPAFATNRNVWCYIDDIYTYLVGRGTGDLPRGRPAKRGEKLPEYTEVEDSCMSG